MTKKCSLKFYQLDVLLLRICGVRRAGRLASDLLGNLTFTINVLFAILFSIANVVNNRVNHIYDSLPTIRELGYIVLITLTGNVIDRFRHLMIFIDETLIAEEKTKVFNFRLCLSAFLYLHGLGEMFCFLVQKNNWLAIEREANVTMFEKVTRFHSTWIANGLYIYTMTIYASTFYSIHLLYVRFKETKFPGLTISDGISPDQVAQLRSELGRLQSLKCQANRILSPWPLVWFTILFISTCLCIVRVVHEAGTRQEILFTNSYTLFLVQLSSLCMIVTMSIYVSIYEEQLTSDIAEYTAFQWDARIEVKMECFKLYQDLRTNSSIPLTIGTLFTIDRRVMLSFFYAAFPMAIITRNFESRSSD